MLEQAFSTGTYVSEKDDLHLTASERISQELERVVEKNTKTIESLDAAAKQKLAVIEELQSVVSLQSELKFLTDQISQIDEEKYSQLQNAVKAKEDELESLKIEMEKKRADYKEMQAKVDEIKAKVNLYEKKISENGSDCVVS